MGVHDLRAQVHPGPGRELGSVRKRQHEPVGGSDRVAVERDDDEAVAGQELRDVAVALEALDVQEPGPAGPLLGREELVRDVAGLVRAVQEDDDGATAPRADGNRDLPGQPRGERVQAEALGFHEQGLPPRS